MNFVSNQKVVWLQIIVIFFVGLGVQCPASAWQSKDEPTLPESWSGQVDWRSIGPANMMGRITSIAVYENDSNIWWASSASGGLIKTVNNGLDFEHQFDDQSTVSIGDVQVSKTDPNLVWVGTGEANPRNSVSWGDGVYKSTDGGKTWKNMGLKKTFQTGRIAIHPENHDIVYVGSLGRLWGPNEERGLFKTTDGGKTWEKVLYVDDKTGVIDVCMNPQNPDELFVATYERMRDGFDGNDPVKKYGPGSGIYKTTDGGKSFRRLTQGLPSCDLGRIGLCIYKKDPTHIVAVIESEKIAKEPDDAANAGLRGENAEVGAKITNVTKDGPADKGGLQENDIVILVDDVIVHSYADLQKGIRKHKAGETMTLVVSRDRKPVDLTIELGKKPQRRQRTGGGNGQARRAPAGPSRTPFTGTLGGQAANLQGQQGDNEHEYGGVYLSKDSGESWQRINTLNPRPMYYSQIRIDPTDINNMYLLGTSLYRSKDGGHTFTGDGGSDGIHVDHHALWIDEDDSRHMILGNDGGIYLTNDRMEHWDHLNHVAIGQFYHVGIGPDRDYRVYGGLQDNGSWGGPSRVNNDSGIVNTDWFRVGGGDGFVCLVDPTDADMIYFESQNGAMGRTNLRTGERGSIRPRAPRGTRYRFNWKTPFVLSPHNSRIHYSAGNHVFRSYNKGTGIKAISPEITNTDKGSGSAITESPVEAGVVYAGTTDGAVWMTKDDGKNWVALFSSKSESDDDQADESEADESEMDESEMDESAESESGEDKSSGDESPETESEEGSTPDSETQQPTDAKQDDPLSGTWVGQMISDRFPEGQAPTLTFALKLGENGQVTGEIETRRGSQEISEAKFDKETGELTITIEGERGNRQYTASIKGKKMTGEMSARDGQFQIEFEATRQDDPGKRDPSLLVFGRGYSNTLVSFLTADGLTRRDDPVSGDWDAEVQNENFPDGRIQFTIELSMDDQRVITGSIDSPRGQMDVLEGEYNPETKKLYFLAENDEVTLDFEASIGGKEMNGNLSINDGAMEGDFSAKQTKSTAGQKPDKSAESAQESSTAPAAETKQEEQKQEEQQQEATTQEPPQQEDPSQTVRRPGFLGVRLNGVTIADVVEDSPAASVGMQSEDVIVSVAGTAVANPQEVLTELRKKQAGDKIQLVIRRDEEEMEFEVTLAAAPQSADRPEGQPSRPAADESSQQEPQAAKEEQAAAESQPAAVVDDPVSGTWTGTMVSPRGDSELTIVLNRKSDSEITGSYETPRSDETITEGSFDPKTKTLVLISDNGRFTLEFSGQVSDDKFAGQVDFNGGTFSMEFDVQRTSRATGGETKQVAESGADSKSSGKSLGDLMPGPRWVSSLQASAFKAGRCYVTFDGHRSNDDQPHLFVTEDYGTSWSSIRGNLPSAAGSVRVLREDIKNENLLFLGCEFGAWVSIDRGKTWTKFGDLPTVAVHEFAIHPTAGEIVAATHGRSLWIADISALRQFSAESIAAKSELYKPNDVVIWRSGARRGDSGTRRFVGENPGNSAKICYSVGSNSRNVELEILNVNGDVIKRFEDLGASKGLHTVEWDLRAGSSGGARGGRGGRGGRFGPRVSAGEYLVQFRADGEKHWQRLSVLNDPQTPVDAVASDQELEWWLEVFEDK